MVWFLMEACMRVSVYRYSQLDQICNVLPLDIHFADLIVSDGQPPQRCVCGYDTRKHFRSLFART